MLLSRKGSHSVTRPAEADTKRQAEAPQVTPARFQNRLWTGRGRGVLGTEQASVLHLRELKPVLCCSQKDRKGANSAVDSEES